MNKYQKYNFDHYLSLCFINDIIIILLVLFYVYGYIICNLKNIHSEHTTNNNLCIFDMCIVQAIWSVADH